MIRLAHKHGELKSMFTPYHRMLLRECVNQPAIGGIFKLDPKINR